MEKAGYILLSIVAVIWIVAIIVGMFAAFPFGIIGLIAIVGIGLLLIKILEDRMHNQEDDYYSKNIEK